MSGDDSDKPHSFDWGLGPTPKEEEEPPELVEPTAPEETPSWDLPTQLTPEQPSWDVPTQLTPEQPSWDLPTQLNPQQPVAPPPAPDTFPDPTGIDALFGAEHFREYDDTLVPPQAPFPTRARQRDLVSAGPREGGPSGAPRTLLIVASVLVGVFVLVLVFVGGTKLQLHTAAAVVPTAAPTTPSPTPTPTSTKTLGAGTYQWDALQGGECITDFENAWQQEYTVVDCDAAHTAQLVVTGTFKDKGYPGVDELADRMDSLCSTRTHVDYSTAGHYKDIEIAGSYPLTAEQWSAGDDRYYCFMSRSSGDPIDGNLSTKPRA